MLGSCRGTGVSGVLSARRSAEAGTSYLYGPGGQPFEQITGSTPIYLQTDAQNSVRLVSDAAGAIVGRYTYGPYGHTDHYEGTTHTALQYDGQYTDFESGYQYLRARYYDPSTGEFLTSDPAVAATGVPYGFAGGDPLDHVDPTGLVWSGGTPSPGAPPPGNTSALALWLLLSPSSPAAPTSPRYQNWPRYPTLPLMPLRTPGKSPKRGRPTARRPSRPIRRQRPQPMVGQ